MSRRSVPVPLLAGLTVAALAATGLAITSHRPELSPAAALTTLDLSSANRRAPIAGLYDWSKAGYRGGANLPGAAETNPNAACQITAAELASQYAVTPNDGVDDSAGLQAAIDAIRTGCSPSANYTKTVPDHAARGHP